MRGREGEQPPPIPAQMERLSIRSEAFQDRKQLTEYIPPQGKGWIGGGGVLFIIIQIRVERKIPLIVCENVKYKKIHFADFFYVKSNFFIFLRKNGRNFYYTSCVNFLLRRIIFLCVENI
jgi:hypothetical protein